MKFYFINFAYKVFYYGQKINSNTLSQSLIFLFNVAEIFLFFFNKVTVDISGILPERSVYCKRQRTRIMLALKSIKYVCGAKLAIPIFNQGIEYQ